MTFYLIGVLIASYMVTQDFIEFCDNNRLDYKEEFRDDMFVMNFILAALGSWLTVLIICFYKMK